MDPPYEVETEITSVDGKSNENNSFFQIKSPQKKLKIVQSYQTFF